MTANQLQTLDCPGLFNESGQSHSPLNVGLFRQLGINRAHIVDQPPLLNAGWHMDGRRLRLQETG
jgi:hypothetical protein